MGGGGALVRGNGNLKLFFSSYFFLSDQFTSNSFLDRQKLKSLKKTLLASGFFLHLTMTYIYLLIEMELGKQKEHYVSVAQKLSSRLKPICSSLVIFTEHFAVYYVLMADFSYIDVNS